MGYVHFEVDTGRAGRRGPPFEDGSNTLANGSVRPALFPGTKQSSACGQLEGRLGTKNDRGRSADPFILPCAALTALCGSAFESVQEFQGAFRALHNFYSSFTPLNSAFLWWEKMLSFSLRGPRILW